MRSLAHIGSIFLASVTRLLSASFFPKVRSLFVCSPAMFRLALGFFSVCPCFVVLSLRDYLFFKWRRRSLSFISKSYDLCYNSKKAALDKVTCFWGDKESIQAKWGNIEAQNTFCTLKEKLEWVTERNILFSFFNETLISISNILIFFFLKSSWTVLLYGEVLQIYNFYNIISQVIQRQKNKNPFYYTAENKIKKK